MAECHAGAFVGDGGVVDDLGVGETLGALELQERGVGTCLGLGDGEGPREGAPVARHGGTDVVVGDG